MNNNKQIQNRASVKRMKDKIPVRNSKINTKDDFSNDRLF